MLDAKEIGVAIAELEYKDSSYSNYAKLESLYTIRDQMTRHADQGYERAYSATPADLEAPTRVIRYGDSDFLRAVEGKDPAAVWDIMDELMDTLKVVNTRVYNSVMRKIDAV